MLTRNMLHVKEVKFLLYKRDKAYIMLKFKGMIIALDKKELHISFMRTWIICLCFQFRKIS